MIFAAVRRRLVPAGRADDSEDVAQDAFLALYRHLSQVPTSAYRPWLYRVARNLCLDQLRRRKFKLRLFRDVERDDDRPMVPADEFGRLGRHLDGLCQNVDRDPADIERTVAVGADDVADVGRYLDAGATHVIVMSGPPFDMTPIESLLAQREAM